MDLYKENNKNYRTMLLDKRSEQLNKIEKEFENITKKLLERKEQIKQTFERICDDELELLDLSLGKQESFYEFITENHDALDSVTKNIGTFPTIFI